MWTYNQTDHLEHHGIPGMKWGVRRYQNSSGNYTAAGKKRYNSNSETGSKMSSASKTQSSNAGDSDKAARQAKIKKAVKIGAVAAGTALTVYGAYKLSKAVKSKAYNQVMERGKKAVEDNLKFSKDFYARKAKTPGINEVQKSTIAYNWANDRRKALRDTDNYRKVANEASKNTYQAVKTLLGKNQKFTNAELRRMGIDVFEPLTFEPDRIKF